MKKVLCLFISLLTLAGSSQLYSNEKDVRQPAVAGQFYPDNPAELSAFVEKVLANVPDQSAKIGKIKPIAVLVPHAGYVYSAQTAAYSFKLLEGLDIGTVVLIGNSHYFPIQGAVDLHRYFKTPLGEIPVNVGLARSIMQKTRYLEENREAHKPEHSLEVELPFLQKIFKNFTIVPIIVGQINMEECSDIGRAIAASLKEKNLAKKAVIIISSDMSHYPSWANANMVDGASLSAIKKFDPQALMESVSSFENSNIPNEACIFCGKEAVYTGMFAAKALGADKAVVLHYANSGDVTGDKSRVVGYGAAVFTAPLAKSGVWGQPAKSKTSASSITPDDPPAKGGEPNVGHSKENSMPEFKISEKNQKELLKLARQSIENYLKNQNRTEIKTNDKELLTPAAVFVTLTINHNLRGCIGTTVAQYPLYKAVGEFAIAAAVEDPRFSPLTLDELKNAKIEISVLSPMQKIKSPDEITPNVSGVLVKRGYRSGLFLPQVWEQLPDKEQFMCTLCMEKAGLEADAWKKPDVDLCTFTVFAFQEK